MASPADAAVEDNLDPLANGIDDVGDKVDRGAAAVELAAAMVRQDHRRRARIGGAKRIVGTLQTLDRKRTAPISGNLGDALPADVGRSEEHTSELQSLMRI